MEDVILKNLIYMLKDETHKMYTHIEYIQAIENLINRNKELEEENRARIIGKYDDITLDELLKDKYLSKSKVIEKLEERFGILCSELGSYERDNATPEQERIAGGINELRKLKKELLQEGDK